METNKYIIELEEMIVSTADGQIPLYKIKGFNTPTFDSTGVSKLTPYTEPDMEKVRKESCDKCMNEVEDLAYQLYSVKVDEAYQRGLNDAWEAARWLAKSNAGINFKIFGWHFTNEIVQEISASEAIDKIQQYEQEQEEQIQVGDEVIGIFSSGEHTKPFVITKGNSDYYFGIYSDSGEFCQGGLKLQKTGRHFPEIAKVLKRMQEETA